MKKQKIEHIYIHVPFCHRKCNYCSFYSEPFTKEKSAEFIVCLLKEIELFKERFLLVPLTLYIGGGTPSILSIKQLKLILQSFDLGQATEITMEMNPIDINYEYIDGVKQLPINRISLGSQSFIDTELSLLSRLHSSSNTVKAIQVLQDAGFKNISLDLIYGLPGQTLKDVVFSLDQIISCAPQHISTYLLSLDENNDLFRLKDLIPVDEILSDFYNCIRKRLLEAGYRQYEISNFSLDKKFSKHNCSYWDDKYYVGLGPSASGYIPDYRYVNSRNLHQYQKEIEQNKIIIDKQEITPEIHEKEYIMLQLRKINGLDLNKYKLKFNIDFNIKYGKIIEKYVKLGLLDHKNNLIKLNPQAYFICNEIFSDFM